MGRKRTLFRSHSKLCTKSARHRIHVLEGRDACVYIILARLKGDKKKGHIVGYFFKEFLNIISSRTAIVRARTAAVSFDRALTSYTYAAAGRYLLEYVSFEIFARLIPSQYEQSVSKSRTHLEQVQLRRRCNENRLSRFAQRISRRCARRGEKYFHLFAPNEEL